MALPVLLRLVSDLKDPFNQIFIFTGDIVTIYKKKDEGWWFGSLNGKKGHFPAAYVEELPSDARNATAQASGEVPSMALRSL